MNDTVRTKLRRRHSYKDGKEFTMRQMQCIKTYYRNHNMTQLRNKYGITYQHALNILSGSDLPFATDYAERGGIANEAPEIHPQGEEQE